MGHLDQFAKRTLAEARKLREEERIEDRLIGPARAISPQAPQAPG
jgi:hypothetical protein